MNNRNANFFWTAVTQRGKGTAFGSVVGATFVRLEKRQLRCTPLPQSKKPAFTLIELLVVIAIIGILAALIIPLSSVATTKMRIARAKAELNQYVTAIESYKQETGSYPPDNTNLMRTVVASDPFAFNYKSNAAMNSLYYELTGAIFTNNPTPGFRTVIGNEAVAASDLGRAFGVSGVQNSARN